MGVSRLRRPAALPGGVPVWSGLAFLSSFRSREEGLVCVTRGGWDHTVKYPDYHTEVGLSCRKQDSQWFLSQEFGTLACLKVNGEQTQWTRSGLQIGYLTVAVLPGVW